jgi:RNA polymerase sigma-70 factor, ECF subfamily
VTAGDPDPDLALLESWRAGDLRAGNELLVRHFSGIRTYFINKLPAEHEDLVQETFTRLVGARDRYRGEASFKTYLFRIARYVLAEYLRRRYRGYEIEPAVSTIADLTDRRPSSVMAEREAHGLLLDSLRRLSLDDQDLLELYYWQDLSAREIAALFELVESTVRSRVRASIKRLRRIYVELSDTPHSRELSLDELERWMTELRTPIVNARLRPS